MKFFYSLLFLLPLFAPLALNAQTDSLKLAEIVNKTKRLSTEQPIEKAYLHFDKPYYAIADTMWFKGYVTSEQNVPSPLSKILYVELWSANNDSLVHSLRLPVKQGMAAGNLPVSPLHFKQGNYYVRAYTQWMLNFDADYFFYKNIAIGEAIDKQLLTHIIFSNQETNQDIKTTARIQFKDLSKKPFANKTVNWQIYSDFDEYSKGKSITDANGFATITVSSKNGKLIKNGNILTNITINEKETLPASFGLKQAFSNIDFQFFPESGTFLEGVPNQMGFKAVKSDGLSIAANGTIIDDAGATIAHFTSGFAGMGSFFITPQAGKNYKAKISFKNGTSQTIDLPQATNNGAALQITNRTADTLSLRILPTAAFLANHKNQPFSIIGINSNVIYYAAQTILKGDVATLKVPTAQFPSGIAQFTLFSSDNKPQAERLAFIYHPTQLRITAKSDLPAYKIRQKVKLNLTSTSFATPAPAVFSVAVTDETKVPVNEDAETTILSSLLLSADLKGYIEKPNYYFNKTNEKKLAELDQLMLTQGYRRFNYANILANKYPRVSLLPEQGITVSGTLRDMTGMPVKKGPMLLMVQDKPISAETTTSNMGVFKFDNLNLPDSSQVTISAKYAANGANLMIMLDGIPGAAKGKNPNSFDELINIDTTLSNYLNNSAKQYRYLRTLKGVEVKSIVRKKINHNDFPTLSGLSSIADREIDGSAFQGCNLLLECLKIRAAGLTFDSNDQKFYVSRDYNTGRRIPVQVFINGMPIDAMAINNTPPSEVDNVEIFLTDQLGTVNRMYNSNGVLAIYTKKKPVGQKISKQELIDLLPKKNQITLSPQGYAKQREFYSPKYLPGKIYNHTDLRTTIYWNPSVFTDAQGNASLEFNNADGKGVYKVVVEGIDKDGNLGRQVYRYQVK